MNLDTFDSIGQPRQQPEVPPGIVSATRRASLPIPRPSCSRGVAANPEASDCTRTREEGGPKVRTENLELVKAISASKVFTEFAHAFKEATGLPVALRPTESFQLTFQDRTNQAPFCALMAGENRSCASCLQSQSQIAEAAGEQPHTGVCFAGLCETAVPLRLGSRAIGFLWTGQVFLRKPSKLQFQRTLNGLSSRGTNLDQAALRGAYFGMRVVSRERYAAAVKLLTIFADHMAMLSNQILIQWNNAEPPMIAKAKNFIREHHAEELSLFQVAQFTHTSPFYFCKLFKRATGLPFTTFVSRVRIESAQRLLNNRQLRVSEVAYEVGFQSLTHFNRVFKRVLGQSPTEYRLKLQGPKKPDSFRTLSAR